MEPKRKTGDKMKRRLKILIVALAVYIALLVILVAVESYSPDATIRSFWDALWFSLITIRVSGSDLAEERHGTSLTAKMKTPPFLRKNSEGIRRTVFSYSRHLPNA